MQPLSLKDRLLESTLLLLVGAIVGVLVQAHVFSRVGGSDKARQLPPIAGEQAANTTSTISLSSPLSGAPALSTPQKNVKQSPAAALDLPPAPGAKLVVSEPSHDFGSAECGNIINHTYVLKNTGKEPLTIGKVKPDCGCAVASISTKTIPPDGESKIAVRVNLALKKGAQNWVFLVQSNDPAQPNFSLRMKGTVTSRVQFDRERVDFGSVPADQMSTSDLKVATTNGLLLEITGTRTSGENVQAKVEVIEPGKQFQVRITLKPPLAAGSFHGWVHVLTNAKEADYRVIGIPVTAMVQGGNIPSPNVPGEKKSLHGVEVGKEMAIAGPTLDGGKVDVAQFKGKPVVVVFWASWCKACQQEMPAVMALHETFKKEGVEVVGVNLDKKTTAAEQYAKEKKLPWPNVHFKSPDGQDASNPLAVRYGIGGIPAIFILDQRGVVVSDRARGKELQEVVTRLLKEKASP